MNTLPICPAGSWWEIAGVPTGDWVWSSDIIWIDQDRAMAAGFFAVASAPGATAIWRYA